MKILREKNWYEYIGNAMLGEWVYMKIPNFLKILDQKWVYINSYIPITPCKVT